ncbi:MAG: ATP-binding protein [Bacteroidales bacterium]|nr:ATP-binding protein [Bacteroidales bacterium]
MLQNDTSQISKLAGFVEAVCESRQLSPDLSMSLNLAIEEAVTNVILYAYPEGTKGYVDIEAQSEEDSLVFIISDSGKAFDPTSIPPADVTASLEDRKIGGLGIFLVRNIMDEVSYERIGGKNVLKLKKSL